MGAREFSVKGSADRFKTIQEISLAAYTTIPRGWRRDLEAVDYYDAEPDLPVRELHLRRRHRQRHGPVKIRAS